jgi:hypothetical protein
MFRPSRPSCYINGTPEDGRKGRNMYERLNNKQVCDPRMCALLAALIECGYTFLLIH